MYRRDYLMPLIEGIEVTIKHSPCIDDITKVINNNPYTVVKWVDGTVTVVKCQDNDVYNFEAGVALCVMKKVFGNDGRYNEVFHKYCETPIKNKKAKE